MLVVGSGQVSTHRLASESSERFVKMSAEL